MIHHSTPIRVMLVDDHRSVLWGLERLIDGEKPRMEVVGTATSQAEALAAIPQAAPDVILLDLDLGGESGVNAIPDFLARCKARVLILKAIEKAYHGELWLDRAATGRIFVELSRRNSSDRKDPNQQKISALTARERQIVIEMASDAGATTRSVAEKMCISEHTLRNHLTSIYDKLGVSSRLELWAYANKHGLTKLSA